MNRPADLRHAYWHEQQLGALAESEHKCPYPSTMLGKRCAWLAGCRDKQRRFA